MISHIHTCTRCIVLYISLKCFSNTEKSEIDNILRCSQKLPYLITYITFGLDLKSHNVLFTACGGNYSQVSGVVQSPNYPKNYPTDAFCQWTIKVSEGYKIRLEFIDLDVERDISCRYDYILVLDGPLSKPTELGKFCGNSTNTVGGYVDSMSNIMTVMFKSDMNKVRRGFEAYWFAQKLSFTPPTPPTRPTEEPVTPSEGTGQIEGVD